MKEIKERLLLLKDDKNADFQRKLTPGIPPESFLGTRVPSLRKLAKELEKEGLAQTFLAELPHKYYDENILHSILLSNEKDYTRCITAIKAFLPYINNWAVCDTLRPKSFARHNDALFGEIMQWIASNETYTIRFAIDCLMSEYLGGDFSPAHLEMVARVENEDYYVRMMVAWYFATALAKQWGATIPFMEQRRLPDWTHKKTIQKAIESYRITSEQKTYLRSLK